MKRLTILLLALLLCACLPTPEQEFVVNKADDDVTIKLEASAKPAADTLPNEGAAVQKIPDRWTETVEANDTLTLAIDAEIVRKADGIFPIFRTKQERFDQAKLAALLGALLPKPKSICAETTTKQQWADALKQWLDQVASYEDWVRVGKPDDGLDREELDLSPERIEAQSQWYMDRINEAPDELGERAVTGYDAVPLYCNSVYTLETGEPVFVSAGEDSLLFARGCRGGVCLYTETQMQ